MLMLQNYNAHMDKMADVATVQSERENSFLSVFAVNCSKIINFKFWIDGLEFTCIGFRAPLPSITSIHTEVTGSLLAICCEFP